MSSVTCKVLIVDDALFMRQVLKDILRSNGIDGEILEASDGMEGVKAFQQHKPDLVIMDINMPRADGIQAVSAWFWEAIAKSATRPRRPTSPAFWTKVAPGRTWHPKVTTSETTASSTTKAAASPQPRTTSGNTV